LAQTFWLWLVEAVAAVGMEKEVVVEAVIVNLQANHFSLGLHIR